MDVLFSAKTKIALHRSMLKYKLGSKKTGEIVTRVQENKSC